MKSNPISCKQGLRYFLISLLPDTTPRLLIDISEFQIHEERFITTYYRSGEIGAIRICGAVLIDFILLLVNNSYKTSNQNR